MAGSSFSRIGLVGAALMVPLLLAGCPPRPYPTHIQTFMLPGDIPLHMVWVPGGTFLMGRYPGEQDSFEYEDPQHEVSVPGFWMGQYPVTQAQWQAVMGTNPSYFKGSDLPVERVSWDNANVFIAQLNAVTGEAFRLPSEAEWEYACRAGTATRFYWGDDPGHTEIGDYAWYSGNNPVWGEPEYGTKPVGEKLPNGFDLYDMAGNVWEWCEDDSHNDYVGAPVDGSPWIDFPRGPYRVLRGGGDWDTPAELCRSAFRRNSPPHGHHYGIGLRLSM